MNDEKGEANWKALSGCAMCASGLALPPGGSCQITQRWFGPLAQINFTPGSSCQVQLDSSLLLEVIKMEAFDQNCVLRICAEQGWLGE